MSPEAMQTTGLVLNAIVVLVLIPLRAAITRLQESDDRLAARVHSLEVEMAKEYMRRSEWDRREDALLTAIARIESKLDAMDHSKADK